MATALVLLAALLLGLPGAFVCARGVAAVRRRRILVQGRFVEGAAARAAGTMLALYGGVMLALAAVLVAVAFRR
jgi:hypothetical protein